MKETFKKELTLRRIGYWKSEHEPHLPHPKDFQDKNWNEAEKQRVIDHLKNGEVVFKYRGYSWCRFECGESNMGSKCLSDGVFIYPEGLVHYLEKHHVKLPDKFIQHVHQYNPKSKEILSTVDEEDIQLDNLWWQFSKHSVSDIFRVDELKQKGKLMQQTVKIGETEILITSSTSDSNQTRKLKYEDLTGPVTKTKIGYKYIFWFSILMLFMSVAAFILRILGKDVANSAEITWLALSLVAFGAYKLFQKEYWTIYIEKGENIHFDAKIPNKGKVKDFINALFLKRNDFLFRRYYRIHWRASYEANIGNLEELLRLNVINRPAFDKQKEKVDEYFKKD